MIQISYIIFVPCFNMTVLVMTFSLLTHNKTALVIMTLSKKTYQRGRRLSTVDLLIKVARCVIKVNYIFNIKIS